MSLDLKHTLSVAEAAARQAGAVLKQAADQPRQIEYKSAIDMVTQYDKQCEALIVPAIRAAFPDHLIIGEEGTGKGENAAGRYCWYIDPIDGTTNFTHNYPHYCTSIGLADPDGVPLLGVVYEPSRDECFTAYRGGGAHLNGRPIHVSKIDKLEHAMLLSGFPYDRWTNPDNNNEEWTEAILRSQSLLCDGSAALDLCYVAAGRADAYWEPDTKPWDVTAGIVLVLEAGGRISNYRGTMDGAYQGKKLVVSNGLIHERLLTVLMMGSMAPKPTIKK
jgi:myo-inositol-1(or 4)-monophosphatase